MDTAIKIYINDYTDIIQARMQARTIARKMGFGTEGQARISLASSELAKALCRIKEPNELVISPAVRNEQHGLQMVCLVQPQHNVSKNGNGTEDNQESILRHIFTGAFQLMDEGNVDVQNDQRAQVTITQWLK